MKIPAVSALVCCRIFAAAALFPVLGRAANVTWDGDTDANADGFWETGVNWSTNAIPAAGDNVQLLNVTGGTREVTISDGSPQTVNKLTITQTTVGAVNVLNVNDNLTISGNAAPFAITATAGQDSIITNIAAGKTLLATNAGSITNSAYAGTINLAAGSIFKVAAVATGADLALGSFGGPINVTGAGAQLVLQRTRNTSGTLAFGGGITVTGDGSTLALNSRLDTNVVAAFSASVNYAGNDGANNSVNLGAGTQFSISGNGATHNFTNKVKLAAASTPAAGAQMSIIGTGGSSTTTANFNGGLDLGAGAKMTLSEGNAAANLAGTSTFGAGAEFLLQFTGAQGNGRFLNSGTLTMDGAALKIDWAATGNNNGLRDFRNTGTWTLKNNASVALISSTGRPVGGGFGNFRNNSNSGTLSVESGSSVGFESLLNTGTINLGSSTGSVSDATVVVGSPASTFTTVILNNGYTTGSSTLNVLGNTLLGREVATTSGIVYLDNGTVRNGSDATTGTDSSTGSTINIGNGTAAATLTVANLSAEVTNATGNTIDLKSNASLLLKSSLTGSSQTGAVVFTNRGTFIHSGTLSFQGNFNGVRTFSHGVDSVYRINGQNAGINALAGNASGVNVAAINFTSSGLVSGSSAYDKLTYTNSSGNSSYSALGLTMSGGGITAGNGTNGAGVSSIGTLEFVNTNITLTGATKLSFDIGGLGNDEAPVDGDFNPILTFDRIVLGASKTFALGTGAVLDIWITNGFYTETAQTYTLIDTGLGGEGSVTGSFATLLFQGQALDADQYTVNIGGGQLSITLAAGLGTPIPEPSTFALLAALATAAVTAGARRRRLC